MPRIIKKKKEVVLSVDPEAPKRGREDSDEKSEFSDSDGEYRKAQRQRKRKLREQRKHKIPYTCKSSSGKEKKKRKVNPERDFLAVTNLDTGKFSCEEVSRRELINYLTYLKANGIWTFTHDPEDFTKDFLYKRYKEMPRGLL